MSSSEMSNEEKRKLANERQNAVRKAWKTEQERIKLGKGTREWTTEEQLEIMERGSAKGYEGHHMKSVSLYPQYAGDPNNIQFLSEEEHLYGAHGGSYHNLTNGYYDPYKKTMVEFNGDELPQIPEYHLDNSEERQLRDEVISCYHEDKSVSNSNHYYNGVTMKQTNGYEV